MNKKVNIGAKPTSRSIAATPDEWVETRVEAEPTKRLTIDIPASLHTRIKTACASRGTKMNEEIRALLEERFPA